MIDYGRFFVILSMFFGFICAGVGVSSLLGFIISLFFKSKRNKRRALYSFIIIGLLSSVLFFCGLYLWAKALGGALGILLVLFGVICACIAIGALLGFIISLFFKSKYHKRIVLYTFMYIGFILFALFLGWIILIVISGGMAKVPS